MAVLFDDFEALCDRIYDADIDENDSTRREWFRDCYLKLSQGFSGFHCDDAVALIWKFLERGFNTDDAYVLIMERLGIEP
tara:strand:- start:189 stop:428 length:240 start_codon:yes stop_codon:yes gene_type:complete